MKRIILIAFVLISSAGVKSQDYVPFPDSVATWNFYRYVFNFEINEISHYGMVYHMAGDTIVNDTAYSKLYARESWVGSGNDFLNLTPDIDYFLIGGIREDSEKKIWYRNFNFENWDSDPWFNDPPYSRFLSGELPDTTTDFQYIEMQQIFNQTSELMLYDFGLEVGDSMLFYDFYWPLEDPYYWSTVESIDVDILGRRNIHFSVPPDLINEISEESEFQPRVWIDGLGDSRADLFSLYDFNTAEGIGVGFYKRLTCFWVNGEQIYSPISNFAPPALTDDCEDLIIGIEEVSIRKLEIYPNPSTGEFRISLPENTEVEIKVFNLLGDMVYWERKIKRDEYLLDITSQENGIYLINVLTKSGDSYFSKIIKK